MELSMKKIENAAKRNASNVCQLDDVPRELRKTEAKKPLFLTRYE
jgi:hypothetical protein